MPKSDGTVTFSVWLDADDAEKELTKVKKKILDLQAELSVQGSDKNALEQSLAKINKEAAEARRKLNALGAAKFRGENVDVRQQAAVVSNLLQQQSAAEAALAKQNASIEENNNSLRKQIALYGMLQMQIMAAGDAGATAGAEAGIAGEETAAAAEQANASVASTGEEANKAGEKAEDAAKKTAESVKEKAEEVAEEVAEKTSQIAENTSSATDALASRLDRVTSRIVGLAKRVLFFSLFTRAFRSFRDFLGKTLTANDEFSAALARLKGALLTAFAPIWNYVIPALTAFINFLSKAVEAVAGFIATLFGSTLSESAAAAESLYNEADAIGKVGGAAGKASKQLAKFDEINQLGSSGGGGGASANKIGTSFDFSSDALKDQINDKIAGMLLITGELLLAVGFITAFTGRIGLGVGLIAAGAAVLGTASELNPEGLRKALEGPIGKVLFVTAELLLVVGFIAAFTGRVGLGIGLIAAGAVMLGTMKRLNPGALASALNGPVAKVLIISGELLLVAGFIVVFTGNIALGIGLIAAGAVVLGSGKALSPEALADALNGPIAKVLVIGGELLLVAGFIVAFTGNIGLGIGLIAAGASVLGSGAIINKDALAEVLNGTIGKVLVVGAELLLVAGFIVAFTGNIGLGVGLIAAGAAVLGSMKVISADTLREILAGKIGSALVLGSELLILAGLILLFTGNIPLGAGLLIAGAGILGSMAILDSSVLLDQLKSEWKAITDWWKTSIAPIFTKEWWSAKFDAIGQGMRSALNAVIGFVENCVNWIVSKLNLLSIDIPPVFGAEGVHLGFNLPYVSIPRLATGAVIPPNREFLAVLGDQTSGTNIEAPLETIVAAFRQAMRESGGGSRTVILEVDGQQFGRVVLDAYNTESRRVGVQLGGAT